MIVPSPAKRGRVRVGAEQSPLFAKVANFSAPTPALPRERGREIPVPLSLPARAYHLAEATNWPFIQRDGLLSTSRLLSAAGLGDAERDCLLREQRKEHTALP